LNGKIKKGSEVLFFEERFQRLKDIDVIKLKQYQCFLESLVVKNKLQENNLRVITLFFNGEK